MSTQTLTETDLRQLINAMPGEFIIQCDVLSWDTEKRKKGEHNGKDKG